jgi:predicted metal-dependent hydrolase
MKEGVFQDQCSIEYGSRLIRYNLLWSKRKTLEIAVHPDMEVFVKAPIGSSRSVVDAKVRKRARWLVHQINYFKQFAPETRKRLFIRGETHFYLGRQYRLKIKKGSCEKVALFRGVLVITTTRPDSSEIVKKLLEKWYREKARLLFQECYDDVWKKFRRFGFDRPELSIRIMNKRWGSLSANGKMILNRDLIKAPRECISYVILHELCHLRYNNHSTSFYKLLESLLPDWERVKHRLEISMV